LIFSRILLSIPWPQDDACHSYLPDDSSCLEDRLDGAMPRFQQTNFPMALPHRPSAISSAKPSDPRIASSHLISTTQAFSRYPAMPRSRPRRDPSAEAHDPQQLTLGGKISALIALGRIPLASEVPLWCLFGCLTSSQIFEGVNPGGEGPFRYWDWWATLQCMLIVWGTNISINYGG